MADNGEGDPPPVNPDYTEFGIKINKFRFTLKVHKRASSAGSAADSERSVDSGVSSSAASNAATTDHYSRVRMRHGAGASSRGRSGGRPRASSSSSSIADSLRLLDLDSNAGSR